MNYRPFYRSCKAEYIKLTSLFSLRLTLALFVTGTVGLALLAGWSLKGALDAGEPLVLEDPYPPAQAGLDILQYGIIPLMVFAVRSITIEYSSGMARLSALAYPSRSIHLAAKATVVTLLVITISVPTVTSGYLVNSWMLGSYGEPVTSAVIIAMIGAVMYLLLMSLLAFFIAAITRSTIVPLATLITMLLAGSQILSLITSAEIARFTPDRAGVMLFRIAPASGEPNAWTSFLIILLWTITASLGSFISVNRRDV